MPFTCIINEPKSIFWLANPHIRNNMFVLDERKAKADIKCSPQMSSIYRATVMLGAPWICVFQSNKTNSVAVAAANAKQLAAPESVFGESRN